MTDLTRTEVLQLVFPGGVPRLWCPPLTHYDADGAIDPARCAAHLAFITRWARGLLVPGSTGDAWELTPAETRAVTDLAVAEAGSLGAHVLVGALHPDAGEAGRIIAETSSRLGVAAGAGSGMPGGSSVCGFAVCPPRGAHLGQEEIEDALAGLLSSGMPMALYQLPQVTENEMAPDLVARLARRFQDFVLFKDTSGADRVAVAGRGGLDLSGVFLVRGAEGDYARHLRENGGGYDGLLLSTANSFGRQLAEIIELSEAGRVAEAERQAARLSSLVGELFCIVEGVPDGNPFANAAKAADHFFAHGPGAMGVGPPRLHAGAVLSPAVLEATEDALRRHDLLPARGYLD